MIRKILVIPFLIILISSKSFSQINPYEFDKVLVDIVAIDNIPHHISIGELWLLRNYIFAKKGYKFKNDGLNEFYGLHYDLAGTYDDVMDKLTKDEVLLINKLKEREKLLRAERTFDVILDQELKIQDKTLIINNEKEIIVDDKRARYINTRQVNKEIYLILIESDYYIDTIGCCGEIGVTNSVVKQFLFYKSSNKIVEVPNQITFGKSIDQIIDQKYVFVLNDIFSAAHDLEIYDLKSFELISRITGIERIDYSNSGFIEIWKFTDKEVEPPYKYVRQYRFENGMLKNMEIEDKVNAWWYFAG